MEFIGHLKNTNDSILNEISYIGIIEHGGIVSLVGFYYGQSPSNLSAISCMSNELLKIIHDYDSDLNELTGRILASPHLMDIDECFTGYCNIHKPHIKRTISNAIMALMALRGNVEYLTYANIGKADINVQLKYIDAILFYERQFHSLILSDSWESCETNNTLLELVGYEVIRNDSVSEFLINGFCMEDKNE